MKSITAKLKKFLFLPPLATVLIAAPSFALVLYVLVMGKQDSPIAIAAYVLSAYALAITITGVYRLIHWAKNDLQAHPFYQRYTQDVALRTKVSLLPGTVINAVYIVMKLVSGILYHSFWMIYLAAYYALLASVRLILLAHIMKNPVGDELISEYHRYRLCGVFLLMVNVVLSVMAAYMVHRNQSYDYPGVLIYAMAAYTFYALITAIINLSKYRKFQSPVLSAVKAISFTTALVTLLSLETAMLDRFGAEDGPEFRKLMTGITTGAVCITVLIMAVFMIVRGTRQIRRLHDSSEEMEKQK